MKINLVAMSGGYDSTAMLALLLNKKEPCKVHYVRLTNQRIDGEIEHERCLRIVEYYKKRYQFEFSASRLDYVRPGWTGPDNLMVLGIVLCEAEREMTRNNQLDLNICFGYNNQDRNFATYATRMKGICDGFFCHCGPEFVKPKLRFPLIEMSKADLLGLIPEELLDVCITCPQPVTGKPCGACFKCGVLAEAFRQRGLHDRRA